MICSHLFPRCEDANLIDMPVRVRGMDPRAYRVAFFAQVNIPPLEELTWDYGCSFKTQEVDVVDALIPFDCKCGSTHCRDKEIDNTPIHCITDMLPSGLK